MQGGHHGTPLSRADIEAHLRAAVKSVQAYNGGQDVGTSRRDLIAAFKAVAPDRRKLINAAGQRVDLKAASIDDLLVTLKGDAVIAMKLVAGDSAVPPYRQVERIFRPVEPTRGAAAIGLVHSVEEAVSVGGALDFGPSADWRTGDSSFVADDDHCGEGGHEPATAEAGARGLPQGVIEILPPSPEYYSQTGQSPLEAVARGLDGASCGGASGAAATSSSPAVVGTHGQHHEEDCGMWHACHLTGGVYSLASHPGFYIMPGCLTSHQQAAVVLDILHGYVERPNRRNIDASVDPDASNVAWAVANGQNLASLRGKAGAGAGSLACEPPASSAGAVSAASAITSQASATAVDSSDSPYAAIAGPPDGVQDSSGPYSSSSARIEASAAPTGPGTHTDQHGYRTQLWREYMAWHRATGTGTGQQPATGDARAQDGTAPASQPRQQQQLSLQQPALTKVTWATLGYQYDWTARAYHCPRDGDYGQHCGAGAGVDAGASAGAGAEAALAAGTLGPSVAIATPAVNRWFAPFPAPLHALSTAIVQAVDTAVSTAAGQGRLGGVENGPALSSDGSFSTPAGSASSLRPWGLPLALDGQAGIVNLYSCASKLPMGGHKDDMERTYDAPVLSISLGCTAVFLLGGDTKEVRPVPVLLRSGDAVLLSGRTRLAFHGVARVFEGTSPRLFGDEAGDRGESTPQQRGSHAPAGQAQPPLLAALDPQEVSALDTYLAGHRLNINVRQVLPV